MSVDRKMLRYSLEKRLGHDVDEAKSGEEAVAKVQQSIADMAPFDAVFLDYVMAEMDGPATARAICKTGFQGRIIGITAFTHADAAEFIAKGGDEMFEKPVSFQLLMKIVTGRRP